MNVKLCQLGRHQDSIRSHVSLVRLDSVSFQCRSTSLFARIDVGANSSPHDSTLWICTTSNWMNFSTLTITISLFLALRRSSHCIRTLCKHCASIPARLRRSSSNGRHSDMFHLQVLSSSSATPADGRTFNHMTIAFSTVHDIKFSRCTYELTSVSNE